MPSLMPFDRNVIHERLAGRQGPAYWRCLEELVEEPGFDAYLQTEFPRLAELWDVPIDRRHFLKVSAAAMALAGATACERQLPEQVVPHVRMPERMVQGKPLFYATTLAQTDSGIGVLVETREGRPLRITGNPEHPASLGALDAINQAAILELYDPDRAQTLLAYGQAADYPRFQAAWAERRAALLRQLGRGLHILTTEIRSPIVVDQLQRLLAMFPLARWHVHTPMDRTAVRRGTELAFDQTLETHYTLAAADCVLALDADFLGNMPGALRYAHDHAANRAVRDGREQPSRLYAIESRTTITGAKADHRLGVKSSEVELVARALANRLGLPVAAPAATPAPTAWLDALVRDLQQHRGRSLIAAGDEQNATVQLLAHAMNNQLDNIGHTVHYRQPPLPQPEPGLAELTNALQADQVDTLLILDGNPAYDAPADLDFGNALAQAPFAVYWGLYPNETATLCHWSIPAAHTLESWGDLVAFDGTVSPVQPVVAPIYGGVELLQLLMDLRGQAQTRPRELLREYWRERYRDKDFDDYWRQSLHDGMFTAEEHQPVEVQLREDWSARLEEPAAREQGLELRFAPDPAVWDGRFANNAWLQELPKPMTKIVWGNALLIGPSDAAELGIAQDQLVQVASGPGTISLPAYLHPGQPPGCVTLYLGAGRSHAGRVGNGIGTNAYHLRQQAQPWFAAASLTPLQDKQGAITTQQHHTMAGRDGKIAQTVTLQELVRQAAAVEDETPNESLYPEYRYDDYAWGMAIDLNACIGCNACVIACQSENNIPTVGPAEVRRGHEMHWLRIDRYYHGAVDAPRVVFQPVPCMHCEKAPCEYVCPVHATTHSSEGLNQMTYNRCIGTRDCSQNCPYKVRRFNFFDYTGSAATTPAAIAAANPDVTVRSRGVMEKCSYCVQRITRARIQAQKEQRRISDDDFTTACAEACPTQAIVFGDINDPDAYVSKLKATPLNYTMLAELNTRPRTTYLVGIRNANSEIDPEEG